MVLKKLQRFRVVVHKTIQGVNMKTSLDFKCNCVTTTVAKNYLQGLCSIEDLKRALEEHCNHACSDFMHVYNLYLEERRRKRLEREHEVVE